MPPAGCLDAGLPGDRTTVLLLYLAMLGMIVDDLTVPGLIAALVDRTLPPEKS